MFKMRLAYRLLSSKVAALFFLAAAAITLGLAVIHFNAIVLLAFAAVVIVGMLRKGK